MKKVIINGEIATLRNEQETRANLLEISRFLNCEQEVLQIFHKYDALLHKCTNMAEREAIALAGNEELHFLLSSKPGFMLVGNKIIGKE